MVVIISMWEKRIQDLSYRGLIHSLDLTSLDQANHKCYIYHMNKPVGIPLSSDDIPAETGLVQTVECYGTKYDETKHENVSRFELPVVAQIITFANGIRRVCCPKVVHTFDKMNATCAKITGNACIYAWSNANEK